MFAQSQVDTLDIATQFVSLMSIMLAQYTYSTNKSGPGKAVATVLFFGINLVLVIAHLSLIAVPLRDKIRSQFVQAQDFALVQAQDFALELGRLQSETSAEEGANSQVQAYS